MQNLQVEEMTVYRGLLCLSSPSSRWRYICCTFPYLLSKFSLTIFYRENIHLCLISSDSSPCHREANHPHLHTHSYLYSSPFRRCWPCGLGGVPILSHGAALPTSQFGPPIQWPPESLCGCIPVPHSLVPPRLAGCNIHLVAGTEFHGRTRGRGGFAPLQPWQRFPKMQPTVLVSLPVFHGSLFSQRLRLPQE